jgi:ribosomal-protein-alanine N-acetyltransferase
VIVETARLTLRRLDEDDAAFAFDLVNDADFLRFIGDKGVRTLEDAKAYLRSGPLASYAKHGFGLFRVARKADDVPVGFCGLLRREYLPAADIGYAFLPAHRGLGYAIESGAAVLEYGRRVHGLTSVLAMTHPDNAGSIRVLERLGLSLERRFRQPGDDHDVLLFGGPLGGTNVY